MSTPLTDEQLAEIQERVDRAREGSIFAWRPTVDDLASLLAEVQRLKTRLAAAEMVCLAYGAAPARPAPSEREKALFELWWEWTELNPEADHTDAGPLTNELIGKLARRRDAKQEQVSASLAKLRELEGETP